jgi:hypothetical protein
MRTVSTFLKCEMRWFSLSLLASLTAPLYAGSNNAELHCSATNAGGSGITLKGEIPGDLAEFKLTLANRNGAVKYSDDDGVAHSVIAFSKGVFTLVVQLNSGFDLILYAIPSTLKAKGGDSRLVDANFDAILLRAPRPGYQPESTQDAYVRNVPMRCSFHHSV